MTITINRVIAREWVNVILANMLLIRWRRLFYLVLTFYELCLLNGGVRIVLQTAV
jgi:hypothetical protein